MTPAYATVRQICGRHGAVMTVDGDRWTIRHSDIAAASLRFELLVMGVQHLYINDRATTILDPMIEGEGAA